jgi:hypothetical protein
MQNAPLVHVDNLSFDWRVTGENCDADILEVVLFGHVAKVYRAMDTRLWVARVDHAGHRKIASESEAKAFAERLISGKVIVRFTRATEDLALFLEHDLVFTQDGMVEPVNKKVDPREDF